MKLFETAWRDNFDYYARFFNTETNKSECEKITGYYEWFEEDPNGKYKYLIDQNIKLSKRSGKRKDGIGMYGLTDPIYRHIRDYYWKERKYNKNAKIWYLDIETRVGTCSEGFPKPEDALEPISLIQFFDSELKTMIILGLRDFEERNDYKLDYKVKYFKFDDEIELIKGFIKIFNTLNPLIIYAWNGANFDFPYLFNRCKNLGIPGIFGNYGDAKLVTKKDDKNRISFSLTSNGHVFFDMIDVYKCIIFAPRASYSLDNISRIELNDNKVEHNEYLDFDSFYTGKNYQISETPYDDTVREEIRQLQIRKKNGENVDEQLQKLINFQFVYYGIYDVYLLKKLDDKIKMSSIFINMASMMGAQLDDILGTIKKWSVYICNVAYERGLIAPPEKDHDDPNIKGGFVRTPIVGKHEWVLNADVNSMYPLLAIVAFNMSPETFVPIAKLPSDLREYVLKYFNDQDEDRVLEIDDAVWEQIKKLLNKYNFSMAINGAIFKKDKIGIIPELVLDIYNNRKKAKGTMLKYHAKEAELKPYLKSHMYTNVNDHQLNDPLEYSSFDSLSENDINMLIEKCSELYELYYTEQYTLKILMNSLYGALGKKMFIFFNEKIAQAITGNGRFFIKLLAKNIEKYYQNIKPINGKYIIYGDTDSCSGDTLIETNKGKFTIRDLYNLSGKETEYKPGKFIKELDDEFLTNSVNSNLELEKKKINYVMKHNVKKQMFKIKANENEVVITCDHSSMVLRNNKLIEVKPIEIQKTDKLILL